MTATGALADLLAQLPGQPDDAVVHTVTDALSRQELCDQAGDLGELLTGSGAVAGSRVAVMLPNRRVVPALFGVWSASCTYVPMNPRLTGAEIDHVLATVRPDVVVTTADDVDRIRGGPVVVAADDIWSPGGAGPGDDGDVEVDDRAVADGVARDPGVALIQFTSGTTGRPKPVPLRHDTVLQLLDGVVNKLRPAGRGDRPAGALGMPNLIPVSLSLWAGIYNVLFAFRVGSPVVVMDRFEPAAFVDLVQRFGIRSTVLPPAAMSMLLDDRAVTDLAPLRYVRSITAPLSPGQARRFHERFGIAVLNSYGQTELGGEIVGWNAADSRRHGQDKLGSVGRPHEGVEVRVEATEADDARGVLWVRTPATADGRLAGSDLADRLTADGWLRTGDLGWVDDDGFVWVEGRESDLINRGGLKVFPAEVEEAIRRLPAVRDVAVVGVPDDRLGEVPWAFVVAGGAVSVDQLERGSRDVLAPYKVPVRFEVVDALPRNEVGKVLSRQLVARAVGS